MISIFFKDESLLYLEIIFELFLCEEEVPFTGTSVFGTIILEHKLEQFLVFYKTFEHMKRLHLMDLLMNMGF